MLMASPNPWSIICVHELPGIARVAGSALPCGQHLGLEHPGAELTLQDRIHVASVVQVDESYQLAGQAAYPA
jgi:hypothetical protein